MQKVNLDNNNKLIFTLCCISEDQRVNIASINMVDRAETWMNRYMAYKKFCTTGAL